jgi:hypothetical protein
MWRAQKAAGYGSIKLVQMKGRDSDWMGMQNKYGEAWEVPVTPSLPWDFRIVSDDGQEVRAWGFLGFVGRQSQHPSTLPRLRKPGCRSCDATGGSDSAIPAHCPCQDCRTLAANIMRR